MHPTLLIGPLPFIGAIVTISSYLLLRAAYLVVAPWLAVRLTTPLGVARRDMLMLFLIGIPVGIAGAHGLALLEGGGHPFETGAYGVWRGSSAIFGGLLAGVATAAVYTACRSISLARVLDGCAPVMALGEGMTRIGCFLSGCCYGKPTTSFLGLTFPHRSTVYAAQAQAGLIPLYTAERSLPVHPTQLYAAAFGFVSCAVLIYWLRRGGAREGRVFTALLASYGVWRFALAYLRADGGPAVLLGLASSQLRSAAAVASALMLGYAWRNRPALPSAHR